MDRWQAMVAPCCGVLIVALSGCRERLEPPRLFPLEGKVTKIDTRRGLITLRYFNDKREREMTNTGRVTDETEILINGAVATLADVRVGELVRGDVRVEGNEPRRILTALHILIERPVSPPSPAPPPSPDPPPDDPPKPPGTP